MTPQKYQQWINQQLTALAEQKYPNNTSARLLYTIGFLQAQLAQAMYNDSKIYTKFKATVSHLTDQ